MTYEKYKTATFKVSIFLVSHILFFLLELHNELCAFVFLPVLIKAMGNIRAYGGKILLGFQSCKI
jgi:hypothetical protein